MIRFKRIKAMWEWRKTLAQGPCCVIQGNQRMVLHSVYESDMRLLETEVNGKWL